MIYLYLAGRILELLFFACMCAVLLFLLYNLVEDRIQTNRLYRRWFSTEETPVQYETRLKQDEESYERQLATDADNHDMQLEWELKDDNPLQHG